MLELDINEIPISQHGIAAWIVGTCASGVVLMLSLMFVCTRLVNGCTNASAGIDRWDMHISTGGSISCLSNLSEQMYRLQQVRL